MSYKQSVKKLETITVLDFVQTAIDTTQKQLESQEKVTNRMLMGNQFVILNALRSLLIKQEVK